MCSIVRNEFVELNLINNIFFQASFKKIHTFLGSLVEGHFLFCLFSL